MEASDAGLWALCLVIGLLPVLTFLIALVLLDSYKLIPLRAVVLALVGGAGSAVICLGLNSSLPSLLALDFTPYSRYVAPVLEELVITNSLPLPEEAEHLSTIAVLSIAPQLAQAIEAIFLDTSVSQLFRGENF